MTKNNFLRFYWIQDKPQAFVEKFFYQIWLHITVSWRITIITCNTKSRNLRVSAPQDAIEADHLIVRVLAQTITRQRARHAALNEIPRQEPSEDLRQLVAVAQKEDPLCARVDKDLNEGSTRPHYPLCSCDVPKDSVSVPSLPSSTRKFRVLPPQN